MGFDLRSASVRAEQTSTGRLAPRPTPLSGVRTLRGLALKNVSIREIFHLGFDLRSASVRAEQTSTGRLAPRPTPLSGVRTLRCLALKKRLYSRRFFNETSGIRIRVSSTKPYRKELRNSSIWIGNHIGNHFISLLGKLFK